jgi:hypothetical protein
MVIHNPPYLWNGSRNPHTILQYCVADARHPIAQTAAEPGTARPQARVYDPRSETDDVIDYAPHPTAAAVYIYS